MSKTDTATATKPAKKKRTYRKTMRWLTLGNDSRHESSGLIEALSTANDWLRSGKEETVSISRMRGDSDEAA